MESMDSLEQMLHSIQRQQYRTMKHLDIIEDDEDDFEGGALQHTALKRAMSAGELV